MLFEADKKLEYKTERRIGLKIMDPLTLLATRLAPLQVVNIVIVPDFF